MNLVQSKIWPNFVISKYELKMLPSKDTFLLSWIVSSILRITLAEMVESLQSFIIISYLTNFPRRKAIF